MDLVDKVMSLLFNMLSRLAITFLPKSKCLLISWLQSSSSAVAEKVRSRWVPHVQGKEQRLHFAGAAVKRYAMSKVRETQLRQ